MLRNQDETNKQTYSSTISQEAIQLQQGQHEDLFKNTKKIINDYQRCQLLAKKSIIDDLTLFKAQNIKTRQSNIQRDVIECLELFNTKMNPRNKTHHKKQNSLLLFLEKAYNLMKVLREEQMEKREKHILNYSEIQGNQKYFVIKADYEKKIRFKSAQEFKKYSHKILIAKVLATKGYGTNCVREYTDCFKYLFSMHKNQFNTLTGALITQTLRKIEYFVKTICRKYIEPFYHQEIKVLYTPLQNYRQKMPIRERNTIQKFIRITFNLSTVVISEAQILYLYVAIVRMCRNMDFTVQDLKDLDEAIQQKYSFKSQISQQPLGIHNSAVSIQAGIFSKPYTLDKSYVPKQVRPRKRMQKNSKQKQGEQHNQLVEQNQRLTQQSHYSFENYSDLQNYIEKGIKAPKKKQQPNNESNNKQNQKQMIQSSNYKVGKNVYKEIQKPTFYESTISQEQMKKTIDKLFTESQTVQLEPKLTHKFKTNTIVDREVYGLFQPQQILQENLYFDSDDQNQNPNKNKNPFVKKKQTQQVKNKPITLPKQQKQSCSSIKKNPPLVPKNKNDTKINENLKTCQLSQSDRKFIQTIKNNKGNPNKEETKKQKKIKKIKSKKQKQKQPFSQFLNQDQEQQTIPEIQKFNYGQKQIMKSKQITNHQQQQIQNKINQNLIKDNNKQTQPQVQQELDFDMFKI